ncbi:hypothetical protein T10_2800 [Trichinella papuae]|uniref:Uncharacterized protein n=1 Tax=Trichinella papuae TaxID=268474 RepID=A0A0V1MZP6_9BILA|nr:hypothetical protein T10_2800 [Trichinella papuae]
MLFPASPRSKSFARDAALEIDLRQEHVVVACFFRLKYFSRFLVQGFNQENNHSSCSSERPVAVIVLNPFFQRSCGPP